MKNKLLLGILFLISTVVYAQPANDNCSGATNLGTLGAPGACGTGIKNGATTTLATTNVAATPENPYTTLAGCGMASPANSVWYKFVAPAAGYGVNISVTGATFANPNIALYTGTCASLTGIGCIVGTGGTATLNVPSGIVAGQTYYIFISGNTGQSGTFTLKVYAFQDCAACLNSASLTVNPLPVNGSYQPGQTVNFCFHISKWTQTSNNWLHGVQMSFGAGWDLSTLTTTPPGPYLSTAANWGGGSPATCGNWKYYPAGITSSANSNTWPAGFYFNGTYTTNIFGMITGCGSDADGDPGNNFGDGLSNSGGVYTPTAADWNFCWSIKVLVGCNPGMSLAVNVNTSGDGESGAWTSVGCSNDPPTTFNALISCCPPTMSSTPTCATTTNGTATTTPVGSASPYVYTWTTGGQTTQTATGLAPGTYTVTVVDKNLCAATNTVVVSALAAPVINAVANITSCIGATVTVPGFTSIPAGASFVWSNSNTTIGLAGNGVGNIPTFTATNTTGVTIVATITVTPTGPGPQFCPGLPVTFTITISPVLSVAVNSPSICLRATANLTATGATTYVWSAGAISSGVNTATASPTTTTSYTVTGSSGTCSSTAVSVVTVNPLPTVTVTPPSSVCNGNPVTLTASGALTYSWSTGQTATSSIIVTPPVGLNTYTVLGIDSKGCTNTANTSVTVNTSPVVTISSPASICFGASATITASGGFAYSWSNGASGIGLSSITVTPPVGLNTYTVIAVSANGCVNSNTTTVNVSPAGPVSISPSVSVCLGGSGVLTASGSGNFLWSTGETTSAITVTPPSTTTYTVNVTNAGGCFGTNTVTVNVDQPPTASASSANICMGQSVQLTAAGGLNYLWTPALYLDHPNIYNPVSTPSATTTYTVEVTNGTLCPPAYATSVVTVSPIPIVNAGVDTSIMAGTLVQIQAAGTGVSYQWQYSPSLSCLNCLNPVASPMKTTTYIITTVDAFGCTSQDTITIYVDDILTLYVPSAFTPFKFNTNNSSFYAYGVGIWHFEFYIFDRWGALVFQSNDPDLGWDGTYKGQMVPQDVYVWLAKAQSITGKNISKTGAVTVVR